MNSPFDQSFHALLHEKMSFESDQISTAENQKEPMKEPIVEWNSCLDTPVFLQGLEGIIAAAKQSKGKNVFKSIPRKPQKPIIQENAFWDEKVKKAYFQLQDQQKHYSKWPVLPVFFTPTELKNFYRKAALILHPDRPTGSSDEFIRLKSDVEILMAFTAVSV